MRLDNRAWYYADERGSILGDTDDSGAVIAINSYDEYGIPGTSYTDYGDSLLIRDYGDSLLIKLNPRRAKKPLAK